MCRKSEDQTYPDFPIKSFTPVGISRDVYIGIHWEFGHLIWPPSSESQVCVTAVILDKEFIQWLNNGCSGQPQTAHCPLSPFGWQVLNNNFDDHMSNILEKKICVGETLPFFLVQSFVAFPSKYYSNICLVFVWKTREQCFYTKFYVSAVDMMFFYRNQMLKSEKNQKLSISVLTPPTRPALRRKQ